MFCENCGHKLERNEKFCTGCGNEIGHIAEVLPSQVIPAQNETNKQSQKRGVGYWLVPASILLIGIIGFVVFIFYQGNDEEQKPTNSNVSETQSTGGKENFNNDIDEESLVRITKTYLDILRRLYYISLDNSPADAETVSGLIFGMMSEVLKDKADLESLQLRVNEMTSSKVDAINTTGLVVQVTIQQLLKSHTELAQYLRTVNENTADIAEFQYQMANFGSQNKQAYMGLAENTALYPVVFFNLSENDNTPGTWKLSEESKKEILTEIDRLFGSVFIEDEENYEKTQTRSAVVFIVKNLRGYFASETTEPFGNSVQ